VCPAPQSPPPPPPPPPVMPEGSHQRRCPGDARLGRPALRQSRERLGIGQKVRRRQGPQGGSHAQLCLWPRPPRTPFALLAPSATAWPSTVPSARGTGVIIAAGQCPKAVSSGIAQVALSPMILTVACLAPRPAWCPPYGHPCPPRPTPERRGSELGCGAKTRVGRAQEEAAQEAVAGEAVRLDRRGLDPLAWELEQPEAPGGPRPPGLVDRRRCRAPAQPPGGPTPLPRAPAQPTPFPWLPEAPPRAPAGLPLPPEPPPFPWLPEAPTRAPTGLPLPPRGPPKHQHLPRHRPGWAHAEAHAAPQPHTLPAAAARTAQPTAPQQPHLLPPRVTTDGSESCGSCWGPTLLQLWLNGAYALGGSTAPTQSGPRSKPLSRSWLTLHLGVAARTATTPGLL